MPEYYLTNLISAPQHYTFQHDLNFLLLPIPIFSTVTMSILQDPTRPIFNAETAQNFVAMVTAPHTRKSLAPHEKKSHMLEFSSNLDLPYLPHETELTY
jgi:hypothetical protein